MPRVLLIKPSSLGDIVHGLQIVQAIADARPELKISWVVRDRFSGLVEAAEFVDEVIPFERKGRILGFLRLLKRVRRDRFDAVLDMQGLLRSGLMTVAARAGRKYGRRDGREGATLFYRSIDAPAGAGPHHALAVLKPFGKIFGVDAEPGRPLRLRPPPAFAWSKFFPGDARSTFVVFSDSRGPEKEWPGFFVLMRMILDRIQDSRVAWCAGRREEPPFDVPDGRFLNLTGCPLDEMIALVRQPSVFIGNDSGPMHLAAAIRNPVVAVFGPTLAARFGPYPLNDPVHRAVEAPGGNFWLLEPETVFAAMESVRG